MKIGLDYLTRLSWMSYEEADLRRNYTSRLVRSLLVKSMKAHNRIFDG